MFTRQSVGDPTEEEVVATTPWHVQRWLVDVGYVLYDLTPITVPDEPTLVHVSPNDHVKTIAAARHFPLEATTLLTDLAEARPLIRTELNVKTHDRRQQISGLVDCGATLDFVSKDFVRRFTLSARKSKTKTSVCLANGQRVASSTDFDNTFEQARHEFQRIFYVVRKLLAVDMELGLPWLDDEQATLHFGTTRVFILMDGRTMENQIEDRRPKCLLMSFSKIQKLMRKTRRGKGRNAEFYVIDISAFSSGTTIIA
jgi:hypothetical protein